MNILEAGSQNDVAEKRKGERLEVVAKKFE
jgi:hypothetical protein